MVQVFLKQTQTRYIFPENLAYSMQPLGKDIVFT
jgi:hypothetical protein